MTDYKYLYCYKDDETYRKSFSELARLTFAIDFEDFYRRGYWSDRYICHSYALGDQIVSNVSVSELEMISDGKKKNVLQIGTVMTRPDHQGRGLAGNLMKKVIDIYGERYDFMYLFANKKVLDFYPKYGFYQAKQNLYRFECETIVSEHMTIRKLDIAKPNDFDILSKIAYGRIPVSDRLGIDKAYYLLMFACMFQHYDHIYLIEELNVLVIYEYNQNACDVYDIVSTEKVDQKKILRAVADNNRRKLILHFTPDFYDYGLSEIPYPDEEDVLFIRASNSEIRNSFCFPITAHA